MTARDLLERRIVPRIVVGLSQVDVAPRVAAALSRLRGGRGRVELFVALDDPESLVALLGLRARLRGRRAVLDVRPVVRRGLPDDPAVDRKRAYAIADARRLLAREGETLVRTTPLPADETAVLAAQVAAIADESARADACEAAMRALWLGGPPPALDTPGDPAALRANEALMARRGPYDTPAAVVGGQWFFAHERLDRIAERLDDLGWRTA